MDEEIFRILSETEITDPARSKMPDTLTKEELIVAIRQSIIAEQDAVALYERFAHATEDSRAKEVFLHVAKEEKHHLGEFQELLERLSGPEEKEEMDKGREETAEEFGEVDDDLGDNEEDTD